MGSLTDLTSFEQFEQLKATPDKMITFCYIQKGVSLCDTARPIATELAKNRPQAMIVIVDCLQQKEVYNRSSITIFPTWKTFLNGELINNYQGGVKTGVVGNFERFWKSIDAPRVAPVGIGKVTTISGQQAEMRPSRGPANASLDGIPLPAAKGAPTSPRAGASISKPAGKVVASEPHVQQVEKKLDMSSLMKYGVDANLLVGQDYQWSLEPKLVQISSGGTHMWGLDSSGMIWRWTGRKFEQVLGQLRQISVSADGAVWGTNFSNDVYMYSKSGWEQVSGTKLKQVSVASRQIVWGVTLQNEVVFYRGDHQWEKIKTTQT